MEKRHKMTKIKIKMKTRFQFFFHFWASLILRTVPTKFEGNRIIILPSTRKICPRLMQLPVRCPVVIRREFPNFGRYPIFTGCVNCTVFYTEYCSDCAKKWTCKTSHPHCYPVVTFSRLQGGQKVN